MAPDVATCWCAPEASGTWKAAYLLINENQSHIEPLSCANQTRLRGFLRILIDLLKLHFVRQTKHSQAPDTTLINEALSRHVM